MVYVVLALTIIALSSLYINYLLIKFDFDDVEREMTLETQSEAHELRKSHDESFRETEGEKEVFVRIAIFDGNAYWVGENGLTTAPLDESDAVEYHLQKPVDVHSMSQKEVNTLLEILDALKEDRDEGGSTG